MSCSNSPFYSDPLEALGQRLNRKKHPGYERRQMDADGANSRDYFRLWPGEKTEIKVLKNSCRNLRNNLFSLITKKALFKLHFYGINILNLNWFATAKRFRFSYTVYYFKPIV